MDKQNQFPPKAAADDVMGRFREIVADPLNLLIERHPLAGTVHGDKVVIHNGHRVPISGPNAYYGAFSQILCINRGVHEPLEEYAFQQLLRRIGRAPCMLELGAYWAHYSMWMKQARPESSVHMVEPEEAYLEAGKYNFREHGYEGEFVHAMVGRDHFEVDRYIKKLGIPYLDVLHSDIQGFEIQMLEGCSKLLGAKGIGYLLVSTHSQDLHYEVIERLTGYGYRVEVSSDFEFETTSFDGFVLASSPLLPAVMPDPAPHTRLQIPTCTPQEILQRLMQLNESSRAQEQGSTLWERFLLLIGLGTRQPNTRG